MSVLDKKEQKGIDVLRKKGLIKIIKDTSNNEWVFTTCEYIEEIERRIAGNRC